MRGGGGEESGAAHRFLIKLETGAAINHYYLEKLKPAVAEGRVSLVAYVCIRHSRTRHFMRARVTRRVLCRS